MKYRYIFDKTIVIVLVLFSLRNAKDWFRDQFVIPSGEGYSSHLLPGGYHVELTLLPILLAIFYQFYLSQNYAHKFRDGVALVVLYALINVGMVRLGLTWGGVILLLICLLVLVFLERKYKM